MLGCKRHSSLCLRIGAADPREDILLSQQGVLIQFSHRVLILRKDGAVVTVEQRGNPDEPFHLTLTRRGDEVTLMVDGEVVLQHSDPGLATGRTRLSVGGYLSRVYLGDARLTPLGGP